MFGKKTTGDPIIHWGVKESTLNIGNYCTIGENVNIYLDGGSIITKNNKWIIPLSCCSCSVTIGNDVWIGSNVTIMPGITIGDGSNIANNSYIASDIKPYSFIYGNPSQIIKYKFNKKQIRILLKIKWWYWNDDKINEYIPLLNGDIDTFISTLSMRKVCLKNTIY
jgi:acetyltransferase-like isoleucine patch superfamily enzyme